MLEYIYCWTKQTFSRKCLLRPDAKQTFSPNVCFRKPASEAGFSAQQGEADISADCLLPKTRFGRRFFGAKTAKRTSSAESLLRRTCSGSRFFGEATCGGGKSASANMFLSYARLSHEKIRTLESRKDADARICLSTSSSLQ